MSLIIFRSADGLELVERSPYERPPLIMKRACKPSAPAGMNDAGNMGSMTVREYELQRVQNGCFIYIEKF